MLDIYSFITNRNDALRQDNIIILFLAVEFCINMLIRSQQSFLISRFNEQDPLKKRKKLTQNRLCDFS